MYKQSEEDQRFFKSKSWKRCRIFVLNRDKYKCQKCGKPANEVHHEPPRSRLAKKDWVSPKFCTSICKPCHSEETAKERDMYARERERPSADGWV